MNFHSIAGVPCASVFDGKATVADCRDFWGECTVIVCRNKKGSFAASVSCGDDDSVKVGDVVEMWNTQNGNVSKFGEVVAVFRPGMRPVAEHAETKMRVWK